MITRSKIEREQLKTIFISLNQYLCQVAFDMVPATHQENMSKLKAQKTLVERARVKLSYSPKTTSCDIIDGLRRMYQKGKKGEV